MQILREILIYFLIKIERPNFSTENNFFFFCFTITALFQKIAPRLYFRSSETDAGWLSKIGNRYVQLVSGIAKLELAMLFTEISDFFQVRLVVSLLDRLGDSILSRRNS